MARVLIIHSERSIRKHLEAYTAEHHHVHAAPDVAHGLAAISKQRPDVVLAGFDGGKREALEVLRSLRQKKIHLPTLVVVSGGAAAFQAQLMSAGAEELLEYPLEPIALNQAIAKVLQKVRDHHGRQPPISDEELAANLTELERQLNRKMVCVAGKNQVYLQSYILGNGQKSKPRIALKCPLRKEQGEPPNVYYEYIRDVCCTDPSVCPAYQRWKANLNL